MREPARGRRDRFFARVGGRPLVMGILNITPDSFSDGGLFSSPEAALKRCDEMVMQGAAIVDVGAESTRPTALAVAEAEEFDRLEPVLTRLIAACDVAVSIDTSKASVARFALRCGAVIVNDIWGLQRDPAMAGIVAEAEAGVVIMHNRVAMVEELDIIADMQAFFAKSLDIAAAAGIDRARIMLDPGIGFGKTARQNLTAVAAVGRLADYGLPIVVGVSRKKFLRGIIADGVEGSAAGTLAVNLAAAAAGAAVFRVHDVAEHVAALEVFTTVRSAA